MSWQYRDKWIIRAFSSYIWRKCGGINFDSSCVTVSVLTSELGSQENSAWLQQSCKEEFGYFLKNSSQLSSYFLLELWEKGEFMGCMHTAWGLSRCAVPAGVDEPASDPSWAEAPASVSGHHKLVLSSHGTIVCMGTVLPSLTSLVYGVCLSCSLLVIGPCADPITMPSFIWASPTLHEFQQLHCKASPDWEVTAQQPAGCRKDEETD